MKLLISTLALLAVSTFASAKVSDIDFETYPAAPLVIDADITIGSGDDAVVVNGPWFQYRNLFRNGTADTLYVVTVKFTIDYVLDGVRQSSTLQLDPSSACGQGMSRPYLAIVGPGETFTGLSLDGTSATSRCDQTLPTNPDTFEDWFITLPGADSSVYSIRAEAIGWTEDSSGKVLNRFSAVQNFVTQ